MSDGALSVLDRKTDSFFKVCVGLIAESERTYVES